MSDQNDLDRLRVSRLEDAKDGHRDHHYEPGALHGAHPSHAWTSGECERCGMRNYWPGGKLPCPVLKRWTT